MSSKASTNVCGMLASVGNHFGRVPDDVIRTDSLIPEGFYADRSPSNFTVPHKEARRELFATDIDPRFVIDEKGEHILFAAYKPVPPLSPTGGGLKPRLPRSRCPGTSASNNRVYETPWMSECDRFESESETASFRSEWFPSELE